jgi:hypothetical protein
MHIAARMAKGKRPPYGIPITAIQSNGNASSKYTMFRCLELKMDFTDFFAISALTFPKRH